MAEETTSTRIQDQNTQNSVSVVPTTDDPTINGVVVCNADWSDIG